MMLKWLYPGMRIKRWLWLALAGLLLIILGVDLLLQGNLLGDFVHPLHELEEQLLGDRLQRIAGVLVVVAGLVVLVTGLLKLVNSIAAVLAPEQSDRVADLIYTRRSLGRGPKIVVIGGGTGLSVLLRGLKEHTSNLTAIVTVADDGGSSGRLRGDLGMLPPGDIRNCLVALADTEPLMEELLQYRFAAGDLAGHSVGNLLLAALNEVTGSFDQSVRSLSKVLAIRGHVLPATLTDVTLCAELADVTLVQGESSIPRGGHRIKRVFLKPPRCLPLPETLAAIRNADAVVLGPGSLYTSIIPNLLVTGIPEALARTSAIKIYICNVMTQRGETGGYTASSHLRAILNYLPHTIDYAVVNTGQIPYRLRNRYKLEGAEPVAPDLDEIEKLGVAAVGGDLVQQTDVVRHHPDKLAQAVVQLALAAKGNNERTRHLNGYKKIKISN
jgi:uncharacterized cofD-like protein